MATVVFQTISSLDEIDYDRVYNDSAAAVDAYYRFPEDVVTLEQRRDFTRDRLLSGIDGTWPLQVEGETFFMYKIIIDGWDHSLHAGFIEADGCTFRHTWMFASQISSEIRAITYSTDFYDAKAAFFQENGITHFKANAIKGTPLHTSIENRVAATVLDVTETNPREGDPARPDKEFVQYIIPLY